MGNLISSVGSDISALIAQVLHWIFSYLCLPWYRWCPEPIGLIPLIAHRTLLQQKNLLKAPLPPPPDEPLPDPNARAATGYGTDKNHPFAGATGSPFGRNCSTVPVWKRHLTRGDPPVQEVAQRLLARRTFQPAWPQLNVMAAAWIQAMVHDWVGHFDADRQVSLRKGQKFGCPLKSFKFHPTKDRDDLIEGEKRGDFYNSFRTQWWDASFVYGQTKEAVDKARTFTEGKLKVDPNIPDVLPREDGVVGVGDVKNSWVGVSLLQELFLKEHNAVAEEIAREHPELADDDEKLFNVSRLVVSAIVAKIHTIDWTVELLKTKTLKVGMVTNWYGLPYALGFPKWFPAFFKLTAQKSANNHGTPFCLTEEFVAVYRLHPLLPDRLIIDDGNESIPMEELVGTRGEDSLRANPNRPRQFWDSCLRYACGGLVLHNYPSVLRDIAPTDDEGRTLPDVVDLAALDLYRDRERGVPRFNQFRRDIGMKPYQNWDKLTGGDAKMVEELSAVYGPDGIEKCDLLVGNLAEKKIEGFAISETSFVIFLLMASRRLESDPFLNEYYNEETYTKAGLNWIENKTESLKDVLRRHYPDVIEDIPEDYSAFTPRTRWPSEFDEADETTELIPCTV